MFWIIVPYQMCIKIFSLSLWPFILFAVFFSAEVLNFNEIAYDFFSWIVPLLLYPKSSPCYPISFKFSPVLSSSVFYWSVVHFELIFKIYFVEI